MNEQIDKYAINKKITKHLKDIGMTKAEFARRVGFKYKKIYDITNNRVQLKYNDLDRICKVFGKSINFFN